MADTEVKNPSETVEGGRYIVNGEVVNAHGEVLEGFKVEKGEIVEGKAKDADEKKK